MRKIVILMVLLSALIAYESEAGLVKIRYESGGQLDSAGNVRYDNVVNVDIWFASVVACWDPGAAICPPNMVVRGANPDDIVAIDEAWNYAIQQIKSGELIGIKHFSTGFTVKWNSSDQTMIDYEIKVWQSIDPEPFKEDYIN